MDSNTPETDGFGVPNTTKLEERMAWCEEYLDQINSALIELYKRVEDLSRKNDRLIDEVRALQNRSTEPFNPRDEKPPHY